MKLLTSFLILLSFAGLCIYSLLFIYSSTIPDDPNISVFSQSISKALKKQLIFFTIGLFIIYIISRIPYLRWHRFALAIYLANIGLLIFVHFAGTETNGAKSWINLGFTRYQPSETMKIAWVIYLASYLRYRDSLKDFSGLIPPFLITLTPVVIILIQPDMGSAFIFIPTIFLILFLVGAKVKHLLFIMTMGVLSTIPMWFFVLKPYQQNRIKAFLDPQEYSLTYSYQLINSLLAIGEGHWLGKGIGQGLVNRFSLLPESHTDFIFSIIAEELGFFGAIGLLICYFIFILASLMLAQLIREPFGRNLVAGITILLGVQVCINLAVTLGLMPTTGVTLPFISSGGSSFLSCCIMMGMIISASRHHVTVLSKDDF